MVALLVLLAATLAPPDERCSVPQVIQLSVRPVSADGKRIALRVRAEMARPGIGAFEVRWGDRSALIADGWWPRRANVRFDHRYPAPGAYRITVTAEGSSEGCRRLRTSEPATYESVVPLSFSPPSEYFSFASVFDSIWRTRSRVTPTSRPMSSSVIGPSPARP